MTCGILAVGGLLLVCAIAEVTVSPEDGVTWYIDARPHFMNTSSARAACQVRGGELLTITSSNMSTSVLEKLELYAVLLYIGLTAETPNAWRWLSTNQPPTYLDWAAGHPRNASALAGADAGAVLRTVNGTWLSTRGFMPAGCICQLGKATWVLMPLVAESL